MSDFKQKAKRGIGWTGIQSITITLFEVIQLTILARILTPEEYGLIAIVYIVMNIGNVFSNVGLDVAIIQRKNPTINELSTMYWLNVFNGLLVFAILYVSSPILSLCFKANELNTLIPVTSLGLIIGAFGTQFQTLLRKKLDFDILAKIKIGAAFAGTIVAVICAFAGLGVWSLVCGNLTRTIFRTIFYVIVGKKLAMLPGCHFKWHDTKGYLSFGLYRTGGLLLHLLSQRVDQIIIGIFLGPAILGYYSIAWRIAVQPITKIDAIFQQIAFPVFSKIQDNLSRLQNYFHKSVRLFMLLIAPILFGMSAIAPIVVPLLIGDKWLPSVQIVQILAMYSLLRSMTGVNGSIIAAKAKVNWTFYLSLAYIFVSPICLLIFFKISRTAHSLAFCMLIIQLSQFSIFYFIFSRKLLQIKAKDFINFLVPIAISILMFFSIRYSMSILGGLNQSILALGVLIAIGIVVYIGLLYFLQHKAFLEISFFFRDWKIQEDGLNVD